MDNSFDVVVVGAGPAGLMAGIEACRMGASVLLLERNDQIGTEVEKRVGIVDRRDCRLLIRLGQRAL